MSKRSKVDNVPVRIVGMGEDVRFWDIEIDGHRVGYVTKKAILTLEPGEPPLLELTLAVDSVDFPYEALASMEVEPVSYRALWNARLREWGRAIAKRIEKRWFALANRKRRRPKMTEPLPGWIEPIRDNDVVLLKPGNE